jgi:hypothetical protein
MIHKFKIFEQTFYKPEKKRPIDYKCLNLMRVLDDLEENHNLKSRKFWDWESKMMENENNNLSIIFPKPLSWELAYEKEKERYDHPAYKEAGIEATRMPYTEWNSVIELPKEYDSSFDEEEYLDNINWGEKNFDYINKHLSKIYELYGEHYKDYKIKCFIYKDYHEDYPVWDYPVLDFHGEKAYVKAYVLSELEDWIESFDMDSTGFYEWILKYNFVEGRYWQRIWGYDPIDDFRKQKAPENIKQINEMLRQLYKIEENKNPEGEDFPIFIDYYKKVDNKIIY